MRILRPALLLVFLAFALVAFPEVILAGRVLFAPGAEALPWLKASQDALTAGRLPLWSSGIALGCPVLAAGQAGVFYPGSALLALGISYYHVYSIMVLAHLVLAALGTALLGRRQGLGWLAAVFAGLAWGFSGCLVSKVADLLFLQGVAWLPLLLWCGLSGAESGRWAWFGGAALVLAASFLGGSAEAAPCSLVALAGLVVYLVAAPPWSGRRVGRAVVGVGLAVALGVGLAAVQLLPTYALSSAAPARVPEAAPLRPADLALFVHPLLFGSPGENDYRGASDFSEACGYVGGLTLFLGLLGLGWRRAPLRHRGLWILLGLLGVGLALASPAFFSDYLARPPGFDLFAAPGHFLLLTALSLSLLAGGAVQALAGAGRRGGMTLALAAAVALVLAAAATYGLPAERLSLTDPIWAAGGGGLLLCGLLGVGIWRLGLGYRPAAALLLLALGGQLYLSARGMTATAPASYFADSPAAAQFFHRDATWGRAYSDPAVTRQSFLTPDYPGYLSGDLTPYREARELLPGNQAWLYDVPAAAGSATLLPERQVRLDEALSWGLAGRPGGAEAPLQVLRMLGVRMLVAAPGLHSPWLMALRERPTYSVYELHGALPRAWFPQQVRAGLERSAGAGLRAAEFRPEATAWVEGLTAAQAARLQGEEALARPGGYDDEGQSWEVSSAHPAFLVFNMAYNPHWQATVRGQPARLLRANYVQCGLVVPAGSSAVRLRYGDEELDQGRRLTQVSGALLLLLLLGTAAGARRARIQRP
ncbi:MAG TPA: hypothetical protein VGM19_01680 [Armatimonadota bacterium]|jgi:hypothetical protein